ncbi:hypothetical protein ACFQQB_63845 [Nonomuraea rubra]|uniref:hypothetical protein n=1 Tax=Nonomuraea rubra TaxID=46180 RepID=UPI00360BCE78
MRTDHPARLVVRVLVAAVLAGFALFFVLPMVWLVLAATKTPAGLIQDNPLSPARSPRCWTTGAISCPSRTARWRPGWATRCSTPHCRWRSRCW